MDAFTYLGIEHAGDHRYRLPITDKVATAASTLFGGAATASLTAVAEHAMERPVIWSSVAFTNVPPVPETVELTVVPVAEGRRVSHARVEGAIDGRTVLLMTASLGQRSADDLEGQWPEPLQVPGPQDCKPREGRVGTADEHVEFRPARIRTGEQRSEPSPDGRFGMWLRVPDLDHGTPRIALVADYVNSFCGQALGERATSKSLDNNLRILSDAHADWMLLDVQMATVSGGYAHGHGYLWTPEGELLAMASQTMTVRRRD
jgi:acyl-CoA thioesterase